MPYSAQQMYDLVNDVESYPQFLPWCSQVEVLLSRDDLLRATLHLTQSGLAYSFTTDNSLTPPHAISLALVDGPFKRFSGRWHFAATASGCTVSLEIEFEFASRVLSFSLGKIFGRIANSMVDAFCVRAADCYGR